MELSVFLAKFFAIYFLVVFMAFIMNRDFLRDAARSMVTDPGNMLLTAIITLIFGIVLVLAHNVWTMDWRVVITILAWLSLVKGVVRMLFPSAASKSIQILENDTSFMCVMVLMLALGLFCGYYGFFQM